MQFAFASERSCSGDMAPPSSPAPSAWGPAPYSTNASNEMHARSTISGNQEALGQVAPGGSSSLPFFPLPLPFPAAFLGGMLDCGQEPWTCQHSMQAAEEVNMVSHSVSQGEVHRGKTASFNGHNRRTRSSVARLAPYPSRCRTFI